MLLANNLKLLMTHNSISNAKKISINDFSYNLPDQRIAQFPINERDSSRLLIYKDAEVNEDSFKNIFQYIDSKALMIFNDTKVIHARFFFQKDSGASIEIMCLNPRSPQTIESSFGSKNSCEWDVLIGNAKKWKEGILEKEVVYQHKCITLRVERLANNLDCQVVKFSWEENICFSEVMNYAGVLPLPPYIHRVAKDEDEKRYQTVYANTDGSVAAPTAGLHFTSEVLNQIELKGIKKEFVTLHVGAGTFKPVKSQEMADHDMHSEQISVSITSIKKIYQQILNGDKIIAVGTTSLRTLESLYWFGLNLLRNKIRQEQIEEMNVLQWEAYENFEKNISSETVLHEILEWMKLKKLDYLSGSTKIIIVPGYNFKLVNCLVTNFHQPQSTLLLLIAAFIGSNWKEVYNYALNNNFRFLSYGDSSILFR